MRKVFHSFFTITLLACVSLLSSCGEDDALAKKITIDGEKFSLSHGYIQGLGAGQDNNDDLVSVYAVVLTTEGLTVVDGGPEGSGTLIMMQFVSPTSLRLANGTYEVIDEEVDFLKNKVFSFATKNFDASVEDSGEEYDAVSGTVKISRSGSTYKITFNVTMIDGEGNDVEVKGSYEGKLAETFFFGGA
jgi:hypothetical protein